MFTGSSLQRRREFSPSLRTEKLSTTRSRNGFPSGATRERTTRPKVNGWSKLMTRRTKTARRQTPENSTETRGKRTSNSTRGKKRRIPREGGGTCQWVWAPRRALALENGDSGNGRGRSRVVMIHAFCEMVYT